MREQFANFLTEKYGTDWEIERVWLSDHSAAFGCDYEIHCGLLYHGGYWNAWAITKGKRTRWFYSYRLRKWMRGRLWKEYKR